MAVYKRGRVWWYRFTWNGRAIRESTKQTNKRVAEQIEAAHKTSLAKGEVGIREKKLAPTLKDFAERDFLPHVIGRFGEKPKTIEYYNTQVRHLTRHAPLAGTAVDCVTPEIIAGFISKQRDAGYQVSSINRALQVLRRMLRLAVEWGKTEKAAPRICLLPGERRRERVLTSTEEAAYLKGAQAIGESILEAYQRSLAGIRATARGEHPIEPDDPYLLRDASTILLDCGLRPEECYRLRWEHYRDGALHIPFGKTANRGDFGMGLSRTHQERTHRAIQLEEVSPQGVRDCRARADSALHLPAHLPYGMGDLHGPVLARVLRGAHQLCHDQALRSPEHGDGSSGDGEGT